MSVIWLQEYLASFSPTTTILVVAHDRDFVDAVAQEVITLRHRTLTYFTGNLSSCERHARKQLKGRARMKDAMDRRKEAMERTIAQGIQSALKTGDENRARMAKSRQKKLDERWGLERSEKGGR
jgi:ATPase subunit of ABC transporter with duplicated ATPase domains